MTFSFESLRKYQDAYTNRHEPEGFRVLAGAYWHALLFLVAVVVFSGAVYGMWRVVVTGGEGNVEEAALVNARGPALERDELTTILEGFIERRERYESLRSNPPQIADPSR